MSTRANRTLCAVRAFILAPVICSVARSTLRISFLPPPSDSRPSRRRYHPDAVAHFRHIRPHGGKPPKLAPHALRTTTQPSEERAHPVGSAGSHNHASGLLLPFQLGSPDSDVALPTPEEHDGSSPDVVLSRRMSERNQVTLFMSHDTAPHKDTPFTNVTRVDHELHEDEPLLSKLGIAFQHAGRDEQINLDSQEMSSSSSIDLRQTSDQEQSINLHTGEPVRAQYRNPVTKARPASRNRDNSAVLKMRRDLLQAARAGNLRNSFNIYLEIKKLARPDVEMADSLISALCWGTLQAPPRLQVFQALQVYKDLVEAEQRRADDGKGFFDSRSIPTAEEQRYYTRIYNTLLRALSAPPSVKSSHRDLGSEVQEEYAKVSMEILAAMEARGLVPDNRAVCSVLLLRFRSARDHEEAYAFYKSLVVELEVAHSRGSNVVPSNSPDSRPTSGTPPLLDLQGYRRVLNAFGKLSFPSAPVAPAPLWFAIGKDMRDRGHPVTIEDYTIYLGNIRAQTTSPFSLQRTAIGLARSQDEESRIEGMLACVKQVHKQLALDVNVLPDATFMNTLANAYQYLGAFDDALNVFNTMWLSGRVDSVTPIIMFDACGHARRPREASLIWCKLVGRGWQFDKHTLDTWVECLCRLGNVEAACKFVCMYMGRDKAGYSSKGDTRPDVQTCLILLKLSWVVGQNLDVKEKIRTHLPHIWKQLTSHYT
ncbi:hypothetical protein JB92DRAFT_2919015 [Gautieria morchelliformis]|nr:hypothetical protein JB92DRAFT_2919015 [Gautieria morchelliformis]